LFFAQVPIISLFTKQNNLFMETKACSGLDVHKDSIYAAVFKHNLCSEVRIFSTLTSDLKVLSQWLLSEGVESIAMESTGIYWVPIWNILEREKFNLILVNPYFIKQMPGRKTDTKDAQWIAELLSKNLLKGSLVPSPQIRTLRFYSRAYVKRIQSITRVVLSIERILESANIHITSMVSCIDSKTVMKVTKSIIEGETDSSKLIKYVHGRVVNRKGEKVVQALEGYVKDEHRYLLSQLMDEYESLTNQANELEKKMIEIGEQFYKEEIRLLKTIPGVSDQSALQLIAETGGDMNAFQTSNKLAKWAGLCPRNDESAGKIKSKATTKGNNYLRRIIVQIAWASCRVKGSYFQSFYRNLAFRKGNKKALIAVARKQLIVTWNVLKAKKEYDPNLQPLMSKEQLQSRKKYYEKELNKLKNLI